MSAGQDTAGIGYRYFRAAEARDDSLVIRSIHRTQTYIQYPYDVLWTPRQDQTIRQLVNEADLIHLNERTYLYHRMRFKQPMLLHHHGTEFRVNHALLTAEARRYGMVQGVSTIDLLRYEDGLTWLPAPYDLKQLAAIRRQYRRPADQVIRIVQTPTDRVLKSTQKLESAVEGLKRKGLPVELVIGAHLPWRESLRLKATADIFFDQTQLGYGCSAIEAWGMGLPVVAGGDEWTENRMRQEFGTDVPYLHAEDTVASIAEAIAALVQSKSLRTAYGRRGKEHVLRFHDEGPALERLIALYDRAMVTRPDPSVVLPAPLPGEPGAPLTFNQRARRLRAIQDAHSAPSARTDPLLRDYY